MLKKEQNEFLTQTGPGTPMGALFRRYWLPMLLSEELPEPDCPPVRVKILSERLLAFRDSSGRLGLVDEFCAHRGVSLWFGRNEQNGLRCPYHGWKYDVEGKCVDVPSEPPESGYCKKVSLKSYPLVELGGIIWAYMGSEEDRPALPEFEFITVSAASRYASKKLQECNFMQAMEGAIDSSHTSFLHAGALESDPLFKGAKGNQYQNDFKPKFEVFPSDGGLNIAVRRNAEPGHYYWRVTPWIMPTFVFVPPRGHHTMRALSWVPIDDENCWSWTIDFHATRTLTSEERSYMQAGFGAHVKVIPGTYRPMANKSNDYLIDRAAQKSGATYSGIDGFAMQDAGIQESMGPIQDRSKEHLVGTDDGVIKARRRLMKAATDLRDSGVRPPGLDRDHQRMRAASIVLPADADLAEALKSSVVTQEDVAPASV